MTRKPIRLPGFGDPIGPFSYGILHDSLIYVSGALGVNENWEILGRGDVRVQAERAFENVRAILEAAGSSLDKVIKMTVYLVNGKDYPAVNDVRRKYFSEPFPASTVVIVRELVLSGAVVEVDVIASTAAPSDATQA